MVIETQDGVAASFILLSYNQEDTIRCAVQSVLSQACEPIEIILSDDASTDSTFDIIDALAKAYDGPHRVVARRNDVNLGTNRHIEYAIELAASDLMIWTAGDDTNDPTRAQCVIDAYRQTSAKLIFSDARTVASDGRPGRDGYKNALFYRSHTLQDTALSFELYLGATAAWHRELYRKYGGFPRKDAFEDLVLGFRAALEGSTHYIEKDLVTYKEGVGISSNLSRHVSKLSNQQRRIAVLKSQIAVLEQRQADAAIFGLGESDPIRVMLAKRTAVLQMRLIYYAFSLAACRPYLAQPGRLAHALLSEMIRDMRKR